ncbi:hypothetical protein LWI28_005509 [Acer negundo]|uniref:Uncharacterized protein n=1 Tax=Acer negundo TaxID=4023 RepID=A0AAD5JF95_ACENE|nr:hypothetical protein LWI28_005509 [Acer negundo]
MRIQEHYKVTHLSNEKRPTLLLEETWVDLCCIPLSKFGNSISGTTMLRTTGTRDTGKSSVPQAPAFSGMSFKEQQLKQLRAQCLVFLAFRNGLMPKKLHLEIALGKEDGPRKDLVDHHTGKAQSSNDPNCLPGGEVQFGRETDPILPGASSSGTILEADSLSREAENSKTMEDKSHLPPHHSLHI